MKADNVITLLQHMIHMLWLLLRYYMVFFMETVIRKFGNSKGAILPAPLLKELNLDLDDKIDARVENGRIVIERLDKHEYSLDELLAQCPQEKMKLSVEDQSWLNDSPVGKEIV